MSSIRLVVQTAYGTSLAKMMSPPSQYFQNGTGLWRWTRRMEEEELHCGMLEIPVATTPPSPHRRSTWHDLARGGENECDTTVKSTNEEFAFIPAANASFYDERGCGEEIESWRSIITGSALTPTLRSVESLLRASSSSISSTSTTTTTTSIGNDDDAPMSPIHALLLDLLEYSISPAVGISQLRFVIDRPSENKMVIEISSANPDAHTLLPLWERVATFIELDPHAFAQSMSPSSAPHSSSSSRKCVHGLALFHYHNFETPMAERVTTKNYHGPSDVHFSYDDIRTEFISFT